MTRHLPCRPLRALAASLLLLAACASDEDRGSVPGAAEWLMEVRSVHLGVDAALAAREHGRAAAALRRVLAKRVPGAVESEHARVVIQDLAFRLAEVELERAEARAALAAANAGLAHVGRRDLFTANLLIMRGAALEALERDTQAAASYYEALEINRALLAAVLAAPAGPDAGPP